MVRLMLIKRKLNEWVFSNVPLCMLNNTIIIIKPKYKIKIFEGEFLYIDSTETEYTLNEMSYKQATQVEQSLHLFKQLVNKK